MTDEPYRPRLHLSPPRGWMNDPNGLIRHGGLWHAFYQHDPGSTLHGPMHWGHATSRDLLSWEHRPPPLDPDHLGACWSGSAIRDAQGQVKLFYTAHRQAEDSRDLEVQCLVHADLEAGGFRRDPANPVLTRDGGGTFRDPKVIWHEGTGRWVMLVTVGQEIAFFSSADLTGWTLESHFGQGQGHHSQGPWECPDLVELRTPDGARAWVLIVGIGDGAPGGGSGTQYFVGSFDGRRFRNANAGALALWVDWGRDCYAAQTFFDPEAEAPLMMAWASNWRYARETPTRAFRGAMTLPRRLSLVRTADGLRLAQAVPEPVRQAFPQVGPGERGVLPGTWRMRLSLEPGLGLHLFGAASPQIARSADGRRLLVARNEPWAESAAPAFAGRHDVPLPDGPISGELFVDRGIVELSLLDGLLWVTQLHFPDDAEEPAMLRPARVDEQVAR